MKQKKMPSVKSLQKKAEELWKKICLKRDGKMCQVKRYHPEISITHSDIINVDHCITRWNKSLFLDPSNGTVVCSACNLAKHMYSKSVGRMIDEIVIIREGFDKFNQMVHLDKSHCANPNWGKRWWLEEKIEELTERLSHT